MPIDQCESHGDSRKLSIMLEKRREVTGDSVRPRICLNDGDIFRTVERSYLQGK